jgi:hypothetical protein
MKLILIVALSFLLASPAMAEGIAFRGKKISGHVAASDRHVVTFWLSGSLAEATYSYMKEEPGEKVGSCSGTIKQFPGFLCEKEGDAFKCFIRMDMEKGVLDGSAGDLCEYRNSIARKAPITAREIYVGEEGMTFNLSGNTAKTIYDQMAIKPIAGKSATGCLGGRGFVKEFDGLSCLKDKNRYLCDIDIKLGAKKMEPLGDACPDR